MNWEPSHADHAIDRAMVTITLRESVDENIFDELVVNGRKAAAAHKLTSRSETQDPIELPPTGGVVSLSSFAALRRVVFRRLDPDHVSPNEVVIDEFSISRQRIFFLTQRYRRWADFRRLIFDILDALDKVAPITNGCKAIRIEYLDSFKSADPVCDYFEVINRDSIYVPAAITTKKTAFHVHCGWFDFEGETVRKLTNVNIDIFDAPIGDPESHRRISILTLAQIEALEGNLGGPAGLLEGLHDYLKSTLREIITTEAAARVSLNQ